MFYKQPLWHLVADRQPPGGLKYSTVEQIGPDDTTTQLSMLKLPGCVSKDMQNTGLNSLEFWMKYILLMSRWANLCLKSGRIAIYNLLPVWT